MGVKFTGKAQQALNRALYLARELGHTYVGTEHLLLGLAAQSECIAAGALSNTGVTYEGIRTLIKKTAGVGEPTDIAPSDMTPGIKKVIEEAAMQSRQGRGGYIGTEHLLYAILNEPDSFAYKLINAKGANITALKNDLLTFVEPDGKKGSQKGRETEIVGAPTLSKYGRNLVKAARDGLLDPVIGRDSETERVMQILSRRTKNNPCLVGEAGVGKTAVVEGLALRIANGNAPETLEGKLVVSLDIPSMIAGAKYRGEFEERLKGVMDEVRKNKELILFIDELHTIIGAGAAEGAVDAANIIKPALSRGELRIIGATTYDEYRRHIEKDAALERRFQPVSIAEPDEEQAIRILEGLRDRYEAHHKLRISDDAIKTAVTLSSRYIRDRYLPDKAIDLIDEAASKKRIAESASNEGIKTIEQKLKDTGAEKKEAILSEDYATAAKLRDIEKKLTNEYRKKKSATDSDVLSERVTVTAADVETLVAQGVGVPVEKLTRGEEEKLTSLERELSEKIIGQSEAVKTVAKAVRRGRAGMKDPERPVATFLFLGPTGVGKTGLTKALAAAVFGSEKRVIRLDMSEYSEKHSVSKIIGSPPGYVGYDNASPLLEAVRKNPYSIVLFDEAEKAHPDVLNILLQILDEGRLSDSGGRVTDFSSTIIILTSNVGGERVGRQSNAGFSAFSDEESQKINTERDVSEELRRAFSPEFINRIDEIIIFRRLNMDDMEKIAGKFLSEIVARLRSSDIILEFSEGTEKKLATLGYDKNYGARALRRTVLRKIEDTLADEIISGRIKKGDFAVCTLDSDGSVLYTLKNKGQKESLTV